MPTRTPRGQKISQEKENIIRRLVSQGLPDQEVARQADVDYRTVQKYKKNTRASAPQASRTSEAQAPVTSAPEPAAPLSPELLICQTITELGGLSISLRGWGNICWTATFEMAAFYHKTSWCIGINCSLASIAYVANYILKNVININKDN